MNEYINKVISLFSKSKPSNETTKQEFYNWLIDDKNVEEKEEALLSLWNSPNDITEQEISEAYNHLQSTYRRKRIIRRLKLFWPAAAILLLVCVTTIYTLNDKNKQTEQNFVEHYSSKGEIKTINLPDGSIVETNSESIIVYPENFGKETRTLYISGEANFKVLKSKDKIPFVVNTKNFSVTALGTEFDVCSYPNDDICRVTLIEGKVKVENIISGINETLNVSEQFSYDRNTTDHLVQTINLDEETAWQRGILMFKGFTIQEIIKVLERNYNVTFHYNTSKINKDKYNFSFKKDITLINLLEVIKNVAGNFDYKLNGDICYIYM